VLLRHHHYLLLLLLLLLLVVMLVGVFTQPYRWSQVAAATQALTNGMISLVQVAIFAHDVSAAFTQV
jgi:uncharacterized membrane protein